MIDFRITRRTALLGMASALAAPAIVRAADYPERPLNIVVPLAPGGYNDRMARAFLTPLGETLGQPLVVINQAGAGTLLGNTYFQQQPDDGYTLMCTNLPFIILTILSGQAQYKLDDFQVINIPSRDYSLVASAPSKNIKSMDDVLERIKKDPSSVSIGLQPGSVDYVNAMLTMNKVGIDTSKLRFVTYDGGGAVRNAVLGGDVDIGIVAAEGYLTLKDRIVPLMIYNEERTPDFPDAPSIMEVGKANGVEGEYVDGAQRSWLVKSSMKTSNPDRYETLVNAFQTTTTDPKVVESLKTLEIESEWIGPEKSQQIYQKTFDSLSKYKDLLKPT